MKEMYEKSLQMIKKYNVKEEKEYNKLAKQNKLLNSESIKYISQNRNFSQICEKMKKA